MTRFADALHALNSMKLEGIVEDYAVSGAVALTFWAEPVETWDLDILVVGRVEAVHQWTEARGYPVADERVIIEGIPTLLVACESALADEAVEAAETLDYEGVDVRVVRPEHLVALYLEPPVRSEKRRARADALLAWPGLNRKRLNAILARHGLEI